MKVDLRRWPRRWPDLALVAVGVLAAAWLLPGLGRGSITNSDDGITATLLREMAHGRSLLDISFQGTVDHQRPLLFYWIGAAVVRLLGATEFAVRLVPALATIAGAVLCAALARRLRAGAAGAIFAGMLYMALYLPVWTSRRVGEDALLAALLAGALLCLLATVERPRMWLGWGALLGLAAMTKGVVASLAVLVAMLDVLATRRAVLRTRWPWLGLVVAALVAAPWHILQTVRYGGAFWANYLGYIVLARVSGGAIAGVSSGAGGSPAGSPATNDVLFYGRDLLRNDPILGTVLLIGLVVAGFLLWRGGRPRRERLVVLAAALVPALLFSLSRTRLPHYGLPLYVPAVALAAVALAEVVRRPLWIGLAAAAALIVAAPVRARELVAPDYAPAMRSLALEAKRQLRPDETLLVFDVYFTAAVFYSERRTMLVTGSREYLAELGVVRILSESRLVRYVSREDFVSLIGPRTCCLTLGRFVPTVIGVMQEAAPGAQVAVWKNQDLALVCRRDDGSPPGPPAP